MIFLGKDNAGMGVASQPVTTEVTPPQMTASEPQLKYAVTETIRYVPVAKEEAYNYRKDASLVSYLNSTEKPRAFSFNDSGMRVKKPQHRHKHNKLLIKVVLMKVILKQQQQQTVW